MELSEIAAEVARLLGKSNRKVVFAESCTAGRIAATLGSVPGISRFLCGSAVVYREQTKTAWLDVDPKTLAEHSAVSEQATRQITQGVLEKTPEADISLGITGHLGPDAGENDGLVFLEIRGRGNVHVESICQQLQSQDREGRQAEATALALALLQAWLTRNP